MTTAFIAGATGYTGREVVRRWIDSGHVAIAHVRPDSPRLDEHRARFEALGAVVSTAAWAPQALRDALARHEPRVVFGLLGTTRKRARRDAAVGLDSSYEAVDYGLTAMLIAAAIGTNRFPRFVYLSALGVDNQQPRGAYLLARWRIEQTLKGGPLPWVITRPSFITGPDREERRPGERVGAALVNGALQVGQLMGGHRLARRYRSQTASELASRLVDLALDPDAVGRIVSSEELTRDG